MCIACGNPNNTHDDNPDILTIESIRTMARNAGIPAAEIVANLTPVTIENHARAAEVDVEAVHKGLQDALVTIHDEGLGEAPIDDAALLQEQHAAEARRNDPHGRKNA